MFVGADARPSLVMPSLTISLARTLQMLFHIVCHACLSPIYSVTPGSDSCRISLNGEPQRSSEV
eukprot:7816192-Pyramimonas_sp.AAC.1